MQKLGFHLPHNILSPHRDHNSAPTNLPKPSSRAFKTETRCSKGKQCQSYPGEPRGEHWEAPEWQQGWEYEEQEHALLLDSAKSADPSVATHTIPGKEGGSATRDTLLLQEQLEGTCCLPATGSSQGSMFLYIPGPEHY